MFKIIDKKILNEIPYKKVRTKVETLDVYRIGVFDNLVYELVKINKGNYPQHKHNNSEAKLHIISGRGKIIINGGEKNYKKWDNFFIPKKFYHGFNVKTETLFLSIQNNPIINIKTGEIDIEYLEKWSRTKKINLKLAENIVRQIFATQNLEELDV